MTVAIAALAMALGAAAWLVWVRRHPAPFPPFFTGMLESRVRRLVAPPEAIVRRLDVAPGARVLEIGPGGGLFAAALAASGRDVALTCVDIQPAMLAKVGARRDVGAPSLVCGDAAALPFAAASFDRVLLVTVLGEIPDRAAALAECRRVLRTDGVVLVAESLPDPDFIPVRRLTREAVAAGLVPAGHAGTWGSYTQRLVRGE